MGVIHEPAKQISRQGAKPQREPLSVFATLRDAVRDRVTNHTR